MCNLHSPLDSCANKVFKSSTTKRKIRNRGDTNDRDNNGCHPRPVFSERPRHDDADPGKELDKGHGAGTKTEASNSTGIRGV